MNDNTRPDRLGAAAVSAKVAAFGSLLWAGILWLYVNELAPGTAVLTLGAWTLGVVAVAAVTGALLEPLYRVASPRTVPLALLGSAQTLTTMVAGLGIVCAVLASLTEAPWPVQEGAEVTWLDLFRSWAFSLGLALTVFAFVAVPLLGLAVGLGQRLRIHGPAAATQQRAGSTGPAPATAGLQARRIATLWGAPFAVTALFLGLLMSLFAPPEGSRLVFLGGYLLSAGAAFVTPSLTARLLHPTVRPARPAWSFAAGFLAVASGVLAWFACMEVVLHVYHGQISDSFTVGVWELSEGWIAALLLPALGGGWHWIRALLRPAAPPGTEAAQAMAS